MSQAVRARTRRDIITATAMPPGGTLDSLLEDLDSAVEVAGAELRVGDETRVALEVEDGVLVVVESVVVLGVRVVELSLVEEELSSPSSSVEVDSGDGVGGGVGDAVAGGGIVTPDADFVDADFVEAFLVLVEVSSPMPKILFTWLWRSLKRF